MAGASAFDKGQGGLASLLEERMGMGYETSDDTRYPHGHFWPLDDPRGFSKAVAGLLFSSTPE